MSKNDEPVQSPHRQWASFRHGVVGGLLGAPPDKGELVREIEKQAAKTWLHPITKKPTKFKFSTIEAWYYRIKNEHHDPVGKLQKKVRSDTGSSRRVTDEIADVIKRQYERYPYWNCQLHYDNLNVSLDKLNFPKPFPSYSTVGRYMKAAGFTRVRRPRGAERQGAVDALIMSTLKEQRSYEAEFVCALWHLDFHAGSIKVLDEMGKWHTPYVLGIFDDCSRLCCHMQWYLAETAENLVHGFCQGLQKCGIPRALLKDNGAAMVSAEFVGGLEALSIEDKRTRPYTPAMNGKCEFVWSRIESRLIAMLEGYKDLTLKELNDLTQAWVEMEYNRHIHRELEASPIAIYQEKKNVGRPCPDSEALRMAFRGEYRRRQRKSDGTISLLGCRYEVPSRLRTCDDLLVKVARWNLSFVHVIDTRTGKIIDRIYPLDRQANADGRRRLVESPVTINPVISTRDLPPLLNQLMSDYRSLGILPAYIPKDDLPKERICKDEHEQS